MHQYYIIPTFEQATELAKTGDFTHSVQPVGKHELHSFKYGAIGNDIWKGDLKDGRLNMRGLTFDGNGKLLCLPWPKFFNYGEISYTQGIDLTMCRYYEKVDGSLMSFFMLDHDVHLKSMRNYYSEVSMEARIKCPPAVLDYCKHLLSLGLSPMMEYVSPTKQIVCWYGEPRFYLLGARSLQSGKISFSNDLPTPPKEVYLPRPFENYEAVAEYLTRKDIEGVVGFVPGCMRLTAGGSLFKLKAETYTQLHRIVSGGVTFKRVVEMLIDEKLDDLKGTLAHLGNKGMLDQIEVHEKEYRRQFDELMEGVDHFVMRCQIRGDFMYPDRRPRKEVAKAMQDQLRYYKDQSRPKFFMGCCFSLLDDKKIDGKVNKWILDNSKNSSCEGEG